MADNSLCRHRLSIDQLNKKNLPSLEDLPKTVAEIQATLDGLKDVPKIVAENQSALEDLKVTVAENYTNVLKLFEDIKEIFTHPSNYNNRLINSFVQNLDNMPAPGSNPNNHPA